MDRRMNVYAFDFDGTLTTRDTLFAFVSFACGRRQLMAWMAFHAPLLALTALRLYPRHKAKERLFAHFFTGMAEADFNAKCRRFAADHSRLLRPAGIDAVAAAVKSGARVLVVSASIDSWVAPFFSRFNGKVTVIGTRAETNGGLLTGSFAGRNCRGAEKVRRITELFPDRTAYRLTAFGDSRGDREMLAMADEAHYKPFRT